MAFIARLSIAGCSPFLALVDSEGRMQQPLSQWRGPQGQRLIGWCDVNELLNNWEHNGPLLSNACLGEESAPLDGFALHSPVTPGQVYCTIGNYRAQVLEAAMDAEPSVNLRDQSAHMEAVSRRLRERQERGEPYVVVKPNAAVSGPTQSIELFSDQQTLDWEVELGVVIGRTARHVRVDEATSYIAGYCTVNDITLRQRVFRSDPPGMGTDFLQAKGGVGWLPVGPWFRPVDGTIDASSLSLELRLNGEQMQQGRVDDMLFTIAAQISYLSKHVELRPGDLLCTGSPAGFGQHHRRFLRNGDVLEATVDGLGSQKVRIIEQKMP